MAKFLWITLFIVILLLLLKNPIYELIILDSSSALGKMWRSLVRGE